MPQFRRKYTGVGTKPPRVTIRYNPIVNTAKDEVRKLLDHLPDDASFEDIQYQVYVLDEIRRGSEEIERGEGLDHEDVQRRLARWLGK